MYLSLRRMQEGATFQYFIVDSAYILGLLEDSPVPPSSGWVPNTHTHTYACAHTHTHTHTHTHACMTFLCKGEYIAFFHCIGNLPQLTVIVRGPSGTHVWAMEMKHKLDSDPVCMINPAHHSPPLLPLTSEPPLVQPTLHAH